jgi:MarR family transcriptional regulator, organic hydroperoxide resistance regulator
MPKSAQEPPLLPTANSFGHNLRQTHRLIQRDLTSRIAGLGLSIGEWYALRALWETDGLTQTELASKAGVAGAAMVSSVRQLLDRGLVSRQRPADDGRKFIISLTPKGWELEHPAIEAAIEANRLALTGIPSDEVALCLRILRVAQDNLTNAGLQEASDRERED